MKREAINLVEFQRRFGSEGACEEQLYRMRWPGGYRCPRCGHRKASYHGTRRLYQCRACRYQASLTAGTVFHKTRTPLTKWFLMIFLMARQKSGVSMLSLQRMLEIKSYKTVWMMAHKIRQAMADRDARYKLAGLIEMDDAFIGPSKPGKGGRGALGKAKVLVAVETRDGKSGFAKMLMVKSVSGQEITSLAWTSFEGDVTAKTDGWPAYRALKEAGHDHQPSVVGRGKQAVKVLPWVHTLIANIKGNLRGVHHGVSNKHLQRYLDEFCYRFNRRFWEGQLFYRLATACVNSTSTTLAELKA